MRHALWTACMATWESAERHDLYRNPQGGALPLYVAMDPTQSVGAYSTYSWPGVELFSYHRQTLNQLQELALEHTPSVHLPDTVSSKFNPSLVRYGSSIEFYFERMAVSSSSSMVLDPLFMASRLLRHRKFEECGKLCTEVLEKNPLDQVYP